MAAASVKGRTMCGLRGEAFPRPVVARPPQHAGHARSDGLRGWFWRICALTGRMLPMCRAGPASSDERVAPAIAPTLCISRSDSHTGSDPGPSRRSPAAGQGRAGTGGRPSPKALRLGGGRDEGPRFRRPLRPELPRGCCSGHRVLGNARPQNAPQDGTSEEPRPRTCSGPERWAGRPRYTGRGREAGRRPSCLGAPAWCVGREQFAVAVAGGWLTLRPGRPRCGQ